MAASRSRRRSAWPDLPADLLGVVQGRLPSLADRVHLRAVCRPWRSSAAAMLHQCQSPPQLPWLVFHDGALLDVSNNRAHRVRIPDDSTICYCAGENMVFLFHAHGRCSLMNTFSSDVTPLPELAALLEVYGVKSSGIRKVLISSSPKLVAVMFRSSSRKGVIAFTSCRLAGEMNSCQVLTETDDRYINMIDVAIFQGKIHAISKDNKLLAVDLNNDEQTPHFGRRIRQVIGASLPSSTASHGNNEAWRYLVESNGKLLMVRRWVSYKWDHEYQERTCQLDVVEADLGHGRWNKVNSLEGRALFVSMLCSKSIPAAAAGGDGARQDCIYFLDDMLGPGLWDSGAYSIGDRRITPLLPEEPAKPAPWNSMPAWFFPVEV